jgi:DNA-binding MarR family transcriptional regulator
MTEGRDDPVVFQVFNEVGIIEQLARTAFERVLPDGLTLSQFSVLNHFTRLGGEKSPVQLARAFQVTKGAMTNTLQRLERRGFIEVRPHPRDGRAKLVSISPAGARARDRAVAAVGPMLADLETEFGRAAFAEALPFLERLRAFLDAARDAGP